MTADGDSMCACTAKKICNKCGIEKIFSDFHKNKSMKNGFLNACKLCHKRTKSDPIKKNISRAAWLLANPEKARASRIAWKANNPDKVKADNAAWRDANPDRLALYRARSKEKDCDPVFAAKRKTRQAVRRALNPGLSRIHEQNRRAREINAEGKLSRGLAKKLFRLQHGMCACCKQPLGTDYHMDHIMPLALGGSNTDDNMQLLKKICNLKKSAKHPVDYMQQLGFLL